MLDINAKFPPVISAFMNSDSRNRHIMGPFRSGKSSGSIVEIIRRAARQKRGPDGYRRSRWMVVRQTMPQLRDTTIKTFFSWVPNGSIGYWRETGKTFYIECDDIRAEVMFRALDDAADVKNLLSLEVTGAYLNEVREIAREIIEGVDGRVGQFPAQKDGGPSWYGVWADTNPPEEGSYLYCMYESLDPDDGKTKKKNHWQLFRQPPALFKQSDGSYILNPQAENLENLVANYYQDLAQGKSDDFIRVNILAQYGRSQGGRPVHPHFDRTLHVAPKPLLPNRDLLLVLGADFGLTPALVLKQQDAFGRVITLDEIVTFDMGLERACEEKLIPLLRRKYSEFETFATGDPSGNNRSQSDESTCAEILRFYKRRYHKSGTMPLISRVRLASTNSPVSRRGATDKYLVNKENPAYLVDPSCEMTIAALSGKFMYKKTKDGRHSEEVDKNDWSHIGEANEYADMYFAEGGRRKAEIKQGDGFVEALRRQAGGNSYAMPRT